LDTILELGLEYGFNLPAHAIDGLRIFVQVTEPKPNILSFFEKFEYLAKLMVDYDAVNRIAYENGEDAKNEGVDYIELRFSPLFMATTHRLDPVGVTEAVVDGVERGKRDFEMLVQLIGIISRIYGV